MTASGYIRRARSRRPEARIARVFFLAVVVGLAGVFLIEWVTR